MDKLLIHLTVAELKILIENSVQLFLDRIPAQKENSLKFYRRREVAELFGVTVQTINSWIKSGQLSKPMKIGRIPMFTEDQFKHLLGFNQNRKKDEKL